MLNSVLIVLKASEGVVDVCLDLIGTHAFGDLRKDTEHTFGVFDLAVALLLHLLDDLLLFLDVHHDCELVDSVYNGIR